MSDKVYFSVDGDDVGKLIERGLIENDEKFLIETSSHIKLWLEKIESIVRDSGGRVVMSGGDMLLSLIDTANVTSIVNALAEAQGSFEFTSSAAVGRTMPEVYFALKVAKSRGKNHFVNLIDENFQPVSESKIILKSNGET
jgi:hypothetical protein